MRHAVTIAAVPYTISFESLVDWLYLDVKGFVTIGAGDLVDPPALLAGLVFVRPDGSQATASEVSAAWLKVKNLQPQAKAGGGTFKTVTTIRATRDSIERIILAKISLNESILKKTFPCWETWPACSQLAALSMAWAYGGAFTRSWPKFTAACLARDWSTASKQCAASKTELSKQNVSFKRRNATQVALFNHAAKGGDPEELMSVNEALLEAVQDGIVTASLKGKTLSPEEYKAALDRHAEEIVYMVPN